MIDTTIEIALTVFVMLMLIAQLIAIKFKTPYTLVLVFIGILTSALAAVATGTNPLSSVLLISVQWIRSIYGQLVSSGLFVGLIVPPLLFEAMMHIKHGELKAVIRPSMVLATVGVLLSTVVAALVVWKFAGLTLFSALLFAVIISPTDTITVLQIFRHINVPQRLSTLMDTEAAFNDATAIVLFSIILSSADLAHASIINGVEIFLYSFAGGGVIGMAVAWTAKKIHSMVNDKLTEITLTIAAVYGTYVLATGIGASGLIAVAIVGLYFGNSTMKQSMTEQVRWSIVSFWEIAAFIGNAVAFLLIGFEMDLSIFFQAAAVIFVAYISTIISRAAAVYPTFAVFRQFGSRIPITWGNIATMGGVRGALSIALLATLASSGMLPASELSTITAMVLGVVFISIIVQVPILSGYAAGLFGRHKTPHELPVT